MHEIFFVHVISWMHQPQIYPCHHGWRASIYVGCICFFVYGVLGGSEVKLEVESGSSFTNSIDWRHGELQL